MNLLSIFLKIMKLFFHDQASRRQIFSSIFALSLSISFILCNIGLMDGYEWSFKEGLREFNADFSILSRNGFYHFDDDLKKSLNKNPAIEHLYPLIQIEAFIVKNSTSKGVLIRGVDSSFYQLKLLKKVMLPGEISLGQTLADDLGVVEGDEVSLLFSRGGSNQDDLPAIKRYIVREIVKHRLYIRDSRMAYTNILDLADISQSKGKINLVLVGVKRDKNQTSADDVNLANDLDKKLRSVNPFLVIRPFWYEFSSLLEAVQIEKISITIALQLVVLVAMFNVLSFINLLFEKRIKEFFILRALGLSWKKLFYFFLMLSFLVSTMSFILSLLMTDFFNFLLNYLEILKIPGKIYELGILSLRISLIDYMIVYLITLSWITMVTIIGLFHLKKRGLVESLRGAII